MLRRSFLGLLALVPWVGKAKAETVSPIGGSFTLPRNCPVCGRTLQKHASYVHNCTMTLFNADGTVRETRGMNWCNCADAPHSPQRWLLRDAGASHS